MPIFIMKARRKRKQSKHRERKKTTERVRLILSVEVEKVVKKKKLGLAELIEDSQNNHQSLPRE